MKHTNKKVLGKGIKYLGLALPFSFIGPSVLFTAFNNQDHPWYIPVLLLGLITLVAAIIFMFRGILTLVKAVFE